MENGHTPSIRGFHAHMASYDTQLGRHLSEVTQIARLNGVLAD